MLTSNSAPQPTYVWYAIKCQQFKDWTVLDYLQQHPQMCQDARIIIDNSKPKKSARKINLSPGVVFVRLATHRGEIDPAVRKWITNVPYVKGFKNYSMRTLSEPMPFSPQTIANLINQQTQPTLKRGKYSASDIGFKLGDYLLVMQGIFAKYEGEVIKIDYNTGILTIATEFFGRLTQIEVNFADCKKVTE